MTVHRPRAAISWSGGKDSLAALVLTRDTYDCVAAVTMFNETGTRTRSHGLRPELIAAQACRLGLRAIGARCSWSTYDAVFTGALRGLRRLRVTHVIFGDLMFSEHRAWAERRCGEAGLVALEPLWGTATDAAFDAFVASGATALLVTVREAFLGEEWLGRALDGGMKPAFAQRGVDPCGELGEYHTAVVDGPMFSSAVRVRPGERVRRGGCVALDLIPEPDSPAQQIEWTLDSGLALDAAGR